MKFSLIQCCFFQKSSEMIIGHCSGCSSTSNAGLKLSLNSPNVDEILTPLLPAALCELDAFCLSPDACSDFTLALSRVIGKNKTLEGTQIISNAKQQLCVFFPWQFLLYFANFVMPFSDTQCPHKYGGGTWCLVTKTNKFVSSFMVFTISSLAAGFKMLVWTS